MKKLSCACSLFVSFGLLSAWGGGGGIFALPGVSPDQQLQTYAQVLARGLQQVDPSDAIDFMEQDEVAQVGGFGLAQNNMIDAGAERVREAVQAFWQALAGEPGVIQDGFVTVDDLEEFAVADVPAGYGWLYTLVLQTLEEIGVDVGESADYALFQARLNTIVDRVFGCDNVIG